MTKRQFDWYLDAVLRRRHNEAVSRAILAGADADNLPEYESHIAELNDDSWLDTRIPVNRNVNVVESSNEEGGPKRIIVGARAVENPHAV